MEIHRATDGPCHWPIYNVAAERYLLLNLLGIKEKGKPFLLNAPMSPLAFSVLFII